MVSLASPLLETDWRSPLQRQGTGLVQDGGGGGAVVADAQGRLEDPFTLYEKRLSCEFECLSRGAHRVQELAT